MGIKLSRKKPRNLLLTFIYRFQKILPLSSSVKFKFYLNLEWIFDRLAHETSFKLYQPEKHPVRKFSKEFMFDYIDETSVVLDLGCKLGDISFIISEKAKEVVGVDYDGNAIKIAKQLYNRPNLKFYNREALEFLKENSMKFDVLILSHILEHLDNPKDFIAEFKDYFKYIYIEVPDFDKYYLNHYRKDLNLSLVYSDSDHVSEFDRNELQALLKECNIKIVKEEYRFGLLKIWGEVITI